jgi:flagellar hook-length control protein FliK
MDLLQSMPMPAHTTGPAAGARQGTRPANGAGQDARVEETGALSFSGVLERQQEKPQPSVTETAARPATGQASGQASGQPAPAAVDAAGLEATTRPEGQIMINQMVKAILGQAPTGESIVSSHPSQQGQAAGNPAAGQAAALPEFRPTGEAGQTIPTTDPVAMVKAMKAQGASGEQAQTKPVPAPVTAKPELTAARIEVPGAQTVHTAETSVPKVQPAPAATPPAAQLASDPATGAPGTATDKVTASQVAGKAPVTTPEAQAATQSAPAEAAVPVAEQEAAPVLSADSTGQEQLPQDKDSTGLNNQAELQAAAAEAKVTASSAQAESAAAQESAPMTRVTRPETTGTGTATRASLLQQGQAIRSQVIRQLAGGLEGTRGNEKVTLQLNPEKLGQVEIHFQARGNDLNIVITASGTEAEQALREGARELSEAIADKSGRWQQVDIRVENRSHDQDKNEARQDNRRDQSRREGRQDQNQHQQPGQRRPGQGPDWASLRGEG